jgi:two-component system chemotaxis response regulator CheV
MSANGTAVQLASHVSARETSTGKMEILLFSLGTREIFGINVFKVREVSQAPAITRTPNMPAGFEGVLSLRGNIIPVISLAKFIRPDYDGQRLEAMIVTEFNRGSHAFLVDSVDRIIRVDWNRVRSPENMMLSSNAAQQNLITAVTELDDGKLVSILDVEQIIASITGEPPVPEIPRLQMEADQFVFFCDDSVIARKEITTVLDKMGLRYQQANNGREAWDQLKLYTQRNWGNGESLHDFLKVILVDAEMPEMDGYTLTRKIKAEPCFNGIPVIMHSSLSSNASRAMGTEAGVDAYVAKFDPLVLSETLVPFLQR